MRRLLLALIPVLYLLHQDWWLWSDTRLLFGFLPVGLAYHIGYTLAVFAWLALFVRFAWPNDSEEGSTV